MPEISVIVPALNEEKYIHNVIDGLEKQTFKDFETIVVDGGSEDNTVKIVKKHAKVIVSYRKGAGSARNAGAKAAKGDILLFLDADTRPSKQLLDTYHKMFQDDKVVAATGPIYPLERSKLRIWIGYKFISVYFVKASMLVGRPSIVGSNFAARKSVFEKANGFNEKFITYEDWDLSNRLKKYGKIAYSDNAMVNTSARRIAAWGVSGYFIFYTINMFMYHFLKRSRTNYKKIR